MKHINVWATFCDAVSFFKNHIFLFLKGMIIPLVLYVLCIVLQFMPLGETPTFNQLTAAALGNLLQPFLVLWMGNICYRLALTQRPGKLWWSMAETWTVVGMFILAMIILVGAGIPAALVYFGLSALNASIVTASVSSGILYGLLLIYLVARFSLLFPGIAVGEKLDLQGTWQMTQDNALKIMVLMFLGIFIFGFIFTVLAALLVLLVTSMDGFMLSLLMAQISSVVIFCVNGISLAFAYRQLK